MPVVLADDSLLRRSPWPLILILWTLLVTAALMLRPPMPVDETRYLSVAWEMWQSGDLLVPRLLGEPYSHKPPLLFWAMHAGWWLFGVNDWWPRLVAPLAGLGCLWATRHLARQLWPERTCVADAAPLILLGASFVTIFITLTMFDLPLTLFVLVATSAFVHAWRDPRLLHGRGWALAALALGAGMLVKGPVVLLHLAPAMLLIPWFLPRSPNSPNRWHWYVGVAGCIAVAVAIIAAWAVPAALSGGPDYGATLLWGQTAQRVTASGDEVNAHAHGWWWYLPLLPALFFPWSVWPVLWRAYRLRARSGITCEPAWRLLTWWLIGVLTALSFIAGKQVHYLVPLLPVAALLVARLLDAQPAVKNNDGILPAIVFLLMGITLLVLPHIDQQTMHILQSKTVDAAPSQWVGALSWMVGVAIVMMAAALWCDRSPSAIPRALNLTLASVTLVVVVHAAGASVALDAFDLRGLSRDIHAWQSSGHAVARLVPHRGEYQFLGRLEQVVDTLEARDRDIGTWVRHHPDGIILAQYSLRRPYPARLGPPATSRIYRGLRLGVWSAKQWK